MYLIKRFLFEYVVPNIWEVWFEILTYNIENGQLRLVYHLQVIYACVESSDC